jgi:cation diffusion facilitator family transporter
MQLSYKNKKGSSVMSKLDSTENYNKVRRILWFILFANLAVALIKIVTGMLIKSTSMTADGFHSLTDGSSNLIGLIGIRLAAKPIDADHPYGHRKFETLAGLFVAAMLFFLSGKIILEAISKFLNPVSPQITLESLIALTLTLIINIFVSMIEYRKGKTLGSQILISDSLHTRSDIYISIGVLLSLGGIKLGLPVIIDPIVSIVVSGFILHAAYQIFDSNSGILVDRAAIDAEKVRRIAMSFNLVKDTHDIRSRGDHNSLYIDMHIVTEPDLNIEQSHKLIHSIEDKIRQDINENAQLNVHLEPCTKR